MKYVVGQKVIAQVIKLPFNKLGLKYSYVCNEPVLFEISLPIKTAVNGMEDRLYYFDLTSLPKCYDGQSWSNNCNFWVEEEYLRKPICLECVGDFEK